jgi:hypothetical protein
MKNNTTAKPPVALDNPTDLWWTRHFQVIPAAASRPPQQQNRQQPVIPPEFPGVVYDALRAFPDAMAAVDKAAQEFYARRVPR